ncbi:MAG: transcriptional repressor NrdR [Candidatus Gracilibacteria bacterium]|nr:transcriptional repressor NrdR [Candidatus Gracilibacteria bacterium]
MQCGGADTKVVDSRIADDGKTVRRRRECEICQNRFTTFEKLEVLDLTVNKSGNKKQKYNRSKLEDSLLKAVNKRHISIGKIHELMNQLEYKWNSGNQITSKQIGADVLESLAELDEVAYIRYASVHENFESAKDFMKFISSNLEK